MLSPPQMAAGLLALIAAGGVTIATSGHKPVLPLTAEPTPIAMSFAALAKSDKFATAMEQPIRPRMVKAIPIPKAGTPEAAELFLATAKPVLTIKTDMTKREELAVQAKNVCERSGGNRVEIIHHHHATWRCVYPHGHQHHHRQRRNDD